MENAIGTRYSNLAFADETYAAACDVKEGRKVKKEQEAQTIKSGKGDKGSKNGALPVYGKAEELFNAISHIVGGGLGIIFSVIAFIVASFDPTPNKYAAVGIYSISIITLYTMSALYHFLHRGTAKRVFRIFDHCTIFLLIAGCYTPFCLITFWDTLYGKIIFFAEWALAVLGITFNAVGLNWKAIKILSQIAYVAMGWMIVFVLPGLVSAVSLGCVIWLLAGGLAYTVGIIFFALGKRVKFMHSIWHLFVVAGSVLQFVSILYIL